MWAFASSLVKRAVRVGAQAFSGAAVGATAGLLFGFLYGTLWGATHGDLTVVLGFGARCAFAGGIAGLLVTTVGAWEGLGIENAGSEKPSGRAGRRSAKSRAGGNTSMDEGPLSSPWGHP